MFDLKRPCVNCPFRKSQGELFQLRVGRLKEIRLAPAFQCHKTLGISRGKTHAGDRPQQCAGIIALNEKTGHHNQITQVAMRLAGYDPATVESKDVFDTWEECIEAHNRGGR